MTKLSRTSLVRVGITTLALTLTACGGGGGSDGTEAPGSATAALSQATDCTDLLASIRADARAKIRVQAEELRERGWRYSGGGSPTPVATTAPAPTPAPVGGPPDSTDTNTQVFGIDEADVVETDGDRIYLFDFTAVVALTAHPPEALGLADRIPIEGYPLGMFVEDGRGLVASLVFDDGALGGNARCDTIGGPFPTNGIAGCDRSFVKLTQLDLNNTPARVAREVYIEGDYVGARRHGTRARVIVQRNWGVPPGVSDPWEALHEGSPNTQRDFQARVSAWEATALAAIDTSTLDDWLPRIQERIGDVVVSHPRDCTEIHFGPPGRSPHGTTVILGVDLADEQVPVDDTTLLGLSSQIYANEDTLLLAYADWQSEPLGEAATRTALHVFALPSGSLGAEYRGSGFVAGNVLSQFALDVRGDIIRAATTYARSLDGRQVTRITTAHIDDGTLEIVGTTGDIAPGETMQSARFLGDRAYLVTFLRIDPLFVVDVHDAARPTVLGEVEVPGFSEYLHPLDDRHLLTIGRGGDGETALQIFDVGDPSAPRRTHVYALPLGFSSPAQGNHLAVTFDRRLGLLALPINPYQNPFGDRPTLELFSIDAVNGITARGKVEHEAAPRLDPCPPFYPDAACFGSPDQMERGLFIADVVYSISFKEVRAQRIDAPGLPLAAFDRR